MKVKPGYKTSEFYLTGACQLVGMIMASGAFPDESGIGKVLGVITVVLSTLGYQYARARVKAPPAVK